MRLMTFILAGITVSTIAACTPGQSEFSCQGYPDGVSCLSARKVYELTNSRSRVTQQEIEGIGNVQGPVLNDVLRPLPSDDPRLGLSPPAGAGQEAASPAEGVMRVWVGPHVTATGDVTAPNYVYSRVDSKAAGNGAGITRRFEPLTGRSEPTPAADARPLEAGDVVVTAESDIAVENSDAKSSRPGMPMTTNNVRVAEIYFESGDATVSTSGRNRLTNAGSRIAELKPRAILVAGFTDRVGSAEANQRLAKQRVEAVVKILRDLGVTVEVLDAAQGEPETLNPGPDGAADPNSRKVWVVALDVAPESRPAAAVESEGQKSSRAASENDATVEQKTSFLTRWFRGSSTATAGDARGCRLCRHPDDHGDNDDRGQAAKDHEPGMKH